jgi:hypothetical protein
MPQLKTITLVMPPNKIALFKAIVESYDNLATLRTEDPRQHHLKLYFAADLEGEVRELLAFLTMDFAITILPSAS